MIKRLILRACELTELTPHEVVKSFLVGAVAAVILLVSIYPAFYAMMAIFKFFEI